MGGSAKHTRMLLRQLLLQGYVVKWPHFEGESANSATWGGKYLGDRYHLRSIDMAVTHGWKFLSDGSFEGEGLREAGWSGSMAGTSSSVEAEEDFLRELKHLRSKTWFTLGDELQLIRLWEEWRAGQVV